jgi:hypothetical protein
MFSSRSARFSLAIAVFGALMALGAIANFNFMFGVAKTAMLISGAIVLAAGCVGLALTMRDVQPRPPAAAVPPAPPAAALEAIRREVRGPAIGLLVTGILNWLLIPLAMLLFSWWGTTVSADGRISSMPPVVLLALTALVLCSFIIFAALKMMRLESRGAALAASVLAILVTPGNIVGLPLGIWALVVLNRREVRTAFAGDKTALASALHTPARSHAVWPWIVAAVGMALLVPVVLKTGFYFLSYSPTGEAVRQVSPNRVLEVRCEGRKADIRAELDDLHDLHLFIGSNALGWSSWYAGWTSVTATVEASDQIKLEDGSMGHGLIFQVRGTRHNIATTPEDPVPGEVVFRPNSMITQMDGTFTFADIRQTNGTLIPVSIRVRPVSDRSPGGQKPALRVQAADNAASERKELSDAGVTSIAPSAKWEGKLTRGTAAPPAGFNGVWPWFRGPNLNAISTETVPLARSWPAGGPAPLWKIAVGEGFAAAAVFKGRF